MSQDEFLFVGEALAFDFVNSEIVARRKPIDLLNTPNDLLIWWKAASNHYQLNMPEFVQVTDATFDKAQRLRGALRRIFTGIVDRTEIEPQDLDTLNDILSTGHTRLVEMPNQRFGLEQVSDDDNPILISIAHSAAWLLTECERERLHKCKNERCVLMFLDTTKNGSRVWCSIDCMNRARSIERYEQRKR